jgi:hypothetical protein
MEGARLPCSTYHSPLGFRVALLGIHTPMEVYMTATTTRRAILAGVAAVPALSLPAIAAVPDPIFAALDRCRAAWAADRAAMDATEVLEELLPDNVRTWRWRVGTPTMPTDPAGDDPRWIAAESASALADIEHCAATTALVSTRPTTLPGLAALINYVSDREAAGYDFLTEQQFSGRCDQDGKPIFCDLTVMLINTLAAASAALAVQS